jgi:hypothetical protein
MLQVTSHLLRDIQAGQQLDEDLVNIKEKIDDPKYKSFRLDHSNTLWFGKWLVVPNQKHLKEQILNEAHESLFFIHPRSNKMYRDVRKRFWWKGLKQDIARFVAECDVCCRVKAEHLKPIRTLQPLPIPGWKWEGITMDLSLDCWRHRVDMIPFGWLSTDLHSQHTSYRSRSPIQFLSMPNCI